jgi:hypothetical protein
MADDSPYDEWDANLRIRRVMIPIPNPALQEWLNGPEAFKAVKDVVDKVWVAYQNELPVRTGNLRYGFENVDEAAVAYAEGQRGAYRVVKRGGWIAAEGGGAGSATYMEERWMGWVGNNALSYNKKKDQPYPRFIEYGKKSRGRAGQGQLAEAVAKVAGAFAQPQGVNIPGISYVPEGRGSKLRGSYRGRFVANPLIPKNTSKPRRRRKKS